MVKKKKENLMMIKCRNFFKRNQFLIIFLAIIVIIGAISILIKGESNDEKIENLNNNIYGDDVIEMYYFHWTRCPHCIEQNKFNKILLEKYPNLKIIEYEVTQEGTREKYEELAQKFDKLPNSWNDFPGTPLTIIGDEFNTGFGTPETTGKKIEEMIQKEQERIDANWDDKTMKRTIELRKEKSLQ